MGIAEVGEVPGQGDSVGQKAVVQVDCGAVAVFCPFHSFIERDGLDGVQSAEAFRDGSMSLLGGPLILIVLEAYSYRSYRMKVSRL